MACPKYLRTDLNPTAQQGGTWTYIGYSSNSPTGPFTATPTPPLVAVAAGGTLVGDNPLVNPASASAGFYQFRYDIDRPPCTPSQAFITLQVQSAANSGTDFSLTLCTSEGTLSLATLFNTNAGTVQASTISITGNAPIGPAPNFTFDLVAAGAGTYTFTRTVTRIPQEGFVLDCADCTDSSTATIEVLDNGVAGIPVNNPRLIVCDYTNPINLHDLISGESTNGSWYFATAPTGAPTYGNTTMTINSNLFNNVTQLIAPGVKLSDASNIASINLLPAAKGFDYRFRYVLNQGTSCEVSSEVVIFASEPLVSGTATNETICFQNLNPSLAFPLASWLTGESGNGSWNITSSPSRPNKITNSWNKGSEDPYNMNRGLDDTFNFLNFRNTAFSDIPNQNLRVPPGSIFNFAFTYTAANALTGPSIGCTPSQTTFTKSIVFTYNTGSAPPPFNIDCTGNQVVALNSLPLYAETGGHWYVAPTVLASSSVAIENLVVGNNPQSTYQPGDIVFSGFVVNVNFTNVPNGTYYLVYVGGTLWSGPNQCPRNTVIEIVKNCCSVNAGITNNTGSTQLTCNTSSISLTATGGTTYQWDHGPTTANVTITGPGVYTVTATDANGCTGQASITITENTTPPNGGITNNTGTNVLTCTTNSISLTAFGGGTYQWSGGLGTNANVTVNQAGTYSVTVTSATTGCTAVYSVVITANTAPPVITITTNPNTNELGCGVNSITLSASGANSYSWNTGQTTQSIAVTTTGTYTVTGIGANGCSGTASQVITNCCPCPCDGDRSVFLLRSVFGTQMLAGNAEITSFVVNGVPQLTSPYVFERRQVIGATYGNCKGCPNGPDAGYNESLVNALSALAITCFNFEQPSAAEINGTSSDIPDGYSTCSNKYIKARVPTCVDWTIVVNTGAGAYDPSDQPIITTYACANGVVTVSGNLALGTNNFPNYSCLYFEGNNVVPVGTDDLCP